MSKLTDEQWELMKALNVVEADLEKKLTFAEKQKGIQRPEALSLDELHRTNTYWENQIAQYKAALNVIFVRKMQLNPD